LTSHQGHKVPTVGGVLLFGRDRLTHFPDAWIQVGRFRGTDKGAIFDHAELKMPLVQAIGEAVAFVEKHAIHSAEIGRVHRQDRWSLPPAAVREAIVNAVAHADYSHRVRRSAWPSLTIDWRLRIPGCYPSGLLSTICR